MEFLKLDLVFRHSRSDTLWSLRFPTQRSRLSSSTLLTLRTPARSPAPDTRRTVLTRRYLRA